MEYWRDIALDMISSVNGSRNKCEKAKRLYNLLIYMNDHLSKWNNNTKLKITILNKINEIISIYRDIYDHKQIHLLCYIRDKLGPIHQCSCSTLCKTGLRCTNLNINTHFFPYDKRVCITHHRAILRRYYILILRLPKDIVWYILCLYLCF